MQSQITDLPQSTVTAKFGGKVQVYNWHRQGRSLKVIYETLGTGQPVLLLPAFSTVSSRAEMGQIATKLATNFQVTVVDWPGFGDSDRLRLNYGPALYQQFLADFITTFSQPIATIAAGHASGYLLQLAASKPTAFSRIGLIAPTWRGPLAVMGAPAAMRNGIKELVRSPLLGQFLYGLNTTPAFLKWMYRRHVFVDEQKLTPNFIAQRHQNTQQPGARYAPAAFVTGGLDPVQQRKEYLAYFQNLLIPALVILAEQAPPSSKAEMEAIADLANSSSLNNLQVVRSSGTLGMAEEYAEDVTDLLLPFLLN